MATLQAMAKRRGVPVSVILRELARAQHARTRSRAGTRHTA
ncbi:MAG: ribbon-helix-helix protein, CopG family [Sphingobacteriales bacterium]|nr:ribbon-helix-helix protein, CopG family [Sphingobacteriales bacterium]